MGEKRSTTANKTACVRAVEFLRPESQRVCCDPYASELAGPIYRLIGKSRLLTRVTFWVQLTRRGLTGSYGSIIARTRFIDDCLEECISEGVEQVVILGAGYDSRAYRFEELSGKARVFEVDHPATQEAKKKRLNKLFGSLPEHVVYVPVDFEKDDLGDRLYSCGYDSRLRSLFIWEGVTMYLDEETIDKTMAFVAQNSGKGSSLIFDYIDKSVTDGANQTEEAKVYRSYLEGTGEPIIYGIDSGTIRGFLHEREFYELECLTECELDDMYFKPIGRDDRGYHWFGYVHAAVNPNHLK